MNDLERLNEISYSRTLEGFLKAIYWTMAKIQHKKKERGETPSSSLCNMAADRRCSTGRCMKILSTDHFVLSFFDWAHPTFVHADPFISQICAHSLKRPQNDCILTIPTIQNPISVHTLLTISHIWARHFHYIPKMCTLQWPVFCEIPYLCTPFP